MTGSTDAADSQESKSSDALGTRADASKLPKRKRVLRKVVIAFGAVVVLLVVAYFVTVNFVARPYLVPSGSMEPTFYAGDRIMVKKLSYRFASPHPGDVIVFKGPPAWNPGYKSIRSHDAAIRWVQNMLSFIGFVPPDENDLVKRVIAVGGQTVQCRNNTGLTVDGKKLTEPYLHPATIDVDPAVLPCLGPEFGPVHVPQGRLWMMGDNRTHSADSRAHCTGGFLPQTTP